MGLLQQGDRTDPVHEHRKIIPVSRFFKKGVCGLQTPFFRPVPTRRQSGRSHVRLVYSSRPAGLPPPAFFQKDGQPPAAPIPKRPSHASTGRNASGRPFRIRPSGTHGPICGSLAPPKQKWLSGRATIRILAGHRCHAVAIKTPSFPSLASRTPPFGTKTSPGVFCRRGTKHKKTATDPCYDRTAPQSSVVTARIRERPCLARACIRRSKERKASCPSE